MKLMGEAFGELSKALCTTFNKSTLAQMLRVKLEKHLDHITAEGNSQTNALAAASADTYASIAARKAAQHIFLRQLGI